MNERIWDGDKIVHELNELGVAAVVEQTGGGVATLYIGTTREFEGPLGPEVRYQAIAGPGWFEGEDWWTEPRFSSLEFGWGLDDDGETSVILPEETDTEVDIARALAAFVA